MVSNFTRAWCNQPGLSLIPIRVINLYSPASFSTIFSRKMLQLLCVHWLIFFTSLDKFKYISVKGITVIAKKCSCPVSRPGTGRNSLSKSRPVPSRGKILSLSRCPFVPGQKKFLVPLSPLSRDNQRTSVPLSRGTRKSCPFGNPSIVLSCKCWK